MRSAALLLAVLSLLVLADATTYAEEGKNGAGPGPATRPATVDIPWTADKLYSYGNEELIIRDFFQDRRGGETRPRRRTSRGT